MKKTLLLLFFFTFSGIFAQTLPVANPISQAVLDTFTKCDNFGNNDGIEQFDLTAVISDVLGTQTVPPISISLHTDYLGANLGFNYVNNPASFQNTSNPQSIYVRVERAHDDPWNTSPEFYVTTEFTVTVGLIPEPNITSDTSSNIICVDNSTGNFVSGLSLDSGISASSSHTYQWSLNGTAISGATNAIYEITTVNPGDYSVYVTSVGGCTGSANFTVVQSNSCSLKTNSFDASNFIMYPNPAKNQVTISLANTNEVISNVNVIDILGKQVIRLNKVNEFSKSIDLTSLNAGIYFIEIETQSKLVVKHKLIIN